MKGLRQSGWLALLAVALVAAGQGATRTGAVPPSPVALSTPEPHLSREGRLVARTEAGLIIEYSPGQEAEAQAVATRLAAWHEELAAMQAVQAAAIPTPSLLSASDMRARSEEILQRIAREIGLKAPTELQRACYEAFLRHYETVSDLHAGMALVAERTAQVQRVEIWNKPELVDRLQAGESIEGYTYDSTTGKVNFQWEIDTLSRPEPEQRAELERADRQRLDRSFNYRIQDGITSYAARFSFRPGSPTTTNPESHHEHQLRRAQSLAKARERIRRNPLITPVVRREEDAAKTPAELAEGAFEIHKYISGRLSASARQSQGPAVLILLHETIEVGMVDHYIGSRDRRWFCDGAANFIAWKIARDLAGAEFARQVYNLDADLAKYAPLQPQIRLREWPAVEYLGEADRGTELTRAHYAFAARVFALMARQHGEDLLPRLFREIGRTQRPKVTMHTVERAYATLTRRKLAALIDEAERAPISPPPGR